MAFRLHWPTQYARITQPFGVNWTGDPDFYRRSGLPGHEGLDFEAPNGSEVYACANGQIVRIALDGNSDVRGKPYGNQIRIRHQTDEGEFETTYAHLQRVRDGLASGMTVRAGELIGYADDTGSSRGAHLHLTLKKTGASAAGETPFPRDILDPTPYLEPFGAPAAAVSSTSAALAVALESTTSAQAAADFAAAASKLGPPPLPQAFNGRYLRQTSEIQFRQRWGWVRTMNKLRYLNLIAIADAPYSSPQMRKTAKNTAAVEAAIRYLNPRPEPNGTPRYWPFPQQFFFCNIFVNDATRLLHCEIPNNPANTSVSQILHWLQTQGGAAGWKAAQNGKEAQDWVNAGKVAVMIWSQGKASDHSALVRPGKVFKDKTGFFWPRVAQAGVIVTGDADSYTTFRGGSTKPRDRLFWFLHD